MKARKVGNTVVLVDDRSPAEVIHDAIETYRNRQLELQTAYGDPQTAMKTTKAYKNGTGLEVEFYDGTRIKITISKLPTKKK